MFRLLNENLLPALRRVGATVRITTNGARYGYELVLNSTNRAVVYASACLYLSAEQAEAIANEALKGLAPAT